MKAKHNLIQCCLLCASVLAGFAAEAQPVITQQPTNQILFVGDNADFGVSVSGDGPFFYQWQFNGTNLPNGIISTLAGIGNPSYYGDGGAATNASLNYPDRIAFDANGNLYIADNGNNCIRKVSTNGVITTVAGNGTKGFSGDNGAATNAMLYHPFGVAVDAKGNLYIADLGNNCIRKVNTNGIITTIAGNGTNGFSGDNGAATNAMLYQPFGVAVDASGNLFIVDTGNSRIRKVNTNGVITTIAGNGTNNFSGDGAAATNAQLNSPNDVAVDAGGNLFIADLSNQRIRKVNTNGIITTVAGNGSYGFSGDGSAATSAKLSNPYGVAVDANGNLFIADYGNVRIRTVNINGIIRTIAGNGTGGYSGDGDVATNAKLNSPTGVAVDADGNLFIADNGNQRIRKVNASGIITTVAGGVAWFFGDGGDSTNAAISYPKGVAVDASSNLFIADSHNNRIRKVNANGIITTVAGKGTNSFSGDGGFSTNAALNGPEGVAVDPNGNLFFADSYNSRIRKVGTDGIIITVAGNGTNGFSGNGGAATNAKLSYPKSLAIDAGGNLFIADNGNSCIRKVNASGIITTVAGNPSLGVGFSGDGGAATSAKLRDPYGVVVDAIGNLFIADTGNNRIRKVNTNGIITTVAGNGTNSFSGDGGVSTNAAINNPFGVSVDINGNLFIADSYNNRIRKVNTNGIITSVVGNGVSGFFGDGGDATIAMLSEPYGVTVDAGGNMFVSDLGNERIRNVSAYNGKPSISTSHISQANAGNYSVIISNVTGSVTSSVVTLTVVPAIITQQPQNQLAALGSTPIFSVSVASTGSLSYQWYLNNLAAAGAVAQTLSGFVYDVIVTNSGAGYTAVPQVQFIGGGGGGAGGTASISNGQVMTITVTNAGSGYTNLPAVVIDPPNGLLVGKTNATLNLSSISTNNADGYYVVVSNIYGSITSSVATLTIAYPPSVSQQPQNQIVATGSGANINFTAAGTSPFSYQWWMTGGLQSNATAVPVVINGFVLGANMTSGGAGYLTIPAVQFVGGSGSGAGGVAVVSNRLVSAITVTNAGSGYTNPPTIQIAAPTAIILTGQTGNVLSWASVTSTNAGNYFVVVTNNYGSVTSSIASLNIAPFGYNQIIGPLLSGSNVLLSFVGLPGTNYVLERSFSLSPPNWLPVVTNPADASGTLLLTNTPDPSTNNFWRFRSVP